MGCNRCQELGCTNGSVASGPAMCYRAEVGSRPGSASQSMAEPVGWELTMVDSLVGMRMRGGALARAVKLRHSLEQDRV